MAIRKSVEETLVVTGARDEWLTRCAKGLIDSGFKEVQTNTTLGQVAAKYRKFPAYGEIQVTATPAKDGHTQLVLRSTADVDNIYALFSSPNKKILTKAKARFS